MLSNTKQPITKQFVLVLLATTVSSFSNCRSFQEVMHYDYETLSAPGFVQNLTIPSGKGHSNYGLRAHENATAIVTQHGLTAAKQPRFLDFKKTITVHLPGTGPWAGYDESSYNHAKDVDFDGFMRYFDADVGSGLVVELENYSTLELGIPSFEPHAGTTYTAEPAKLFKSGSKVALTVYREVEMKITISSANVLTISMDREMAEENYSWFATQDAITGLSVISSGSLSMGNISIGTGPNQCLDTIITTTPDVPTSSPTQPSGVVARRSGILTTAFTTLVAVALVALW